jgi:hypothetical protein
MQNQPQIQIFERNQTIQQTKTRKKRHQTTSIKIARTGTRSDSNSTWTQGPSHRGSAPLRMQAPDCGCGTSPRGEARPTRHRLGFVGAPNLRIRRVVELQVGCGCRWSCLPWAWSPLMVDVAVGAVGLRTLLAGRDWIRQHNSLQINENQQKKLDLTN